MIVNYRRTAEELDEEIELIEKLDRLLGPHGWKIHYDMNGCTIKLTKTDLRDIRAEYDLSLLEEKTPEVIAEEFLKKCG